MKHYLTTRTWQDDTGCPISIILAATSDETYLGVENYIRRMIVKSIDHEWLAEVKSEKMGFNHLSPRDLLTHLRNVGGSLNHMDVTELFTNIQKPWVGIEAPAAHFARGDKYERQLLKVGQNKNPEL